jgi:hypothetical protein
MRRESDGETLEAEIHLQDNNRALLHPQRPARVVYVPTSLFDLPNPDAQLPSIDVSPFSESYRASAPDANSDSD